MAYHRRTGPVLSVRIEIPRLGWAGFAVLVVAVVTLTASAAVAQTVTECGFPDLTVEEVATVTSLTGSYLGVCWLGRILLRMMT